MPESFIDLFIHLSIHIYIYFLIKHLRDWKRRVALRHAGGGSDIEVHDARDRQEGSLAAGRIAVHAVARLLLRQRFHRVQAEARLHSQK